MNPICVRLSEDELAVIALRQEQSGLSRSELIRRAVLNVSISSVLDYNSVQTLAKLNADQARLGNLLMLTIKALGDVEEKHVNGIIDQVTELEQNIRTTQDQIKSTVLKVRL